MTTTMSEIDLFFSPLAEMSREKGVVWVPAKRTVEELSIDDTRKGLKDLLLSEGLTDDEIERRAVGAMRSSTVSPFRRQLSDAEIAAWAEHACNSSSESDDMSAVDANAGRPAE